MKHIKLFEDFERGGIYPVSKKMFKIIQADYPWINDPSIIYFDNGYFYLDDVEYKNIHDMAKEYFNIVTKKLGIDKKSKINNKTNLIDVDDSVDMRGRYDNIIPLKFGVVKGSFICDSCNLTSLSGSPVKVGEDFSCTYNNIENLVGGPVYVKGSFLANNTNLKTLEGSPRFVGSNFNCNFNPLTSLKYLTGKIGGYLKCSKCLLTSFDCPNTIVKKELYAIGNELKNMLGCPKVKSGGYYIESNENLVSLHGIQGQINYISFHNSPLYWIYFLFSLREDEAKKYFESIEKYKWYDFETNTIHIKNLEEYINDKNKERSNSKSIDFLLNRIKDYYNIV